MWEVLRGYPRVPIWYQDLPRGFQERPRGTREVLRDTYGYREVWPGYKLSYSLLMVLGGSWGFFVVLGGFRWFLVILGGSWCFLVVLGGSWWFLVVLGGSWWFMVVLSVSWWFLVVLCGSLWFLVIFCWFQKKEVDPHPKQKSWSLQKRRRKKIWKKTLWYWCYYLHRSRDSVSSICGIFNRPGVAGAVLQSPPSFID